MIIVIKLNANIRIHSKIERMKKALITGITGQDGSYLAELLLQKGYEVHGIIRRASTFNTERIDHLYQDPHEHPQKLFLHYGDLGEDLRIVQLLEKIQPDEIYNLGAQSHVKVSFDQPVYTADIVATGTLRLLEAVRDSLINNGKKVRFYQAGSSEMFGIEKPPQSETTPFHPRSPYGVAKVSGYWYAVNYRESYDMFVCNGILFNHESERRGETFVTRKITRAVGRIKMGLQEKLYLGNLSAVRDWGHAADYVEAMWMMLQHDLPDDYVVATGEAFSVKQFLERTFELAELDWQSHVEIDSRYYRPAEVDFLLGDSSKIRSILSWKHKIVFEDLVKRMYNHDLKLAVQEKILIDNGHTQASKGSGHI